MHINPKKLQVIPYGIDTKKFQNNPNGEAFKIKYNCNWHKVILSVGRLNYQKAFHYLIKAMPKILKKIPKVKLIIVGEGEQSTYLNQLANFLGVKESVIFTGALDQNQISDAYAACDIFVLSSQFESFGISLIEAQAAGKPVIGTKVGGLPEALLDRQTGFLVDFGDIGQLEDNIIHLLSDEKIAKEIGKKGKAFVENQFSTQRSVDSIINLCERTRY